MCNRVEAELTRLIMGTREVFNNIEQALPLALKIFAILSILMIFVSLVVYGVSVYFEHRVISIGKTTRQVQQDNQELQITLDRIRSYHKVADVSAKLKDGLQVASQTLDLAEVRSLYKKSVEPRKERLPDGAYGY